MSPLCQNLRPGPMHVKTAKTTKSRFERGKPAWAHSSGDIRMGGCVLPVLQLQLGITLGRTTLTQRGTTPRHSLYAGRGFRLDAG